MTVKTPQPANTTRRGLIWASAAFAVSGSVAPPLLSGLLNQGHDWRALRDLTKAGASEEALASRLDAQLQIEQSIIQGPLLSRDDAALKLEVMASRLSINHPAMHQVIGWLQTRTA